MATTSPANPDLWVAGLDGYRGGWVAVLAPVEAAGPLRVCRLETFDGVLTLPGAPVQVGVDMVIGLPEAAQRGGRACDRAARQILGRPRGSSVFSPPVRAVLAATSYAEALAHNRASSAVGLGISIEAYHLLPKIREVDAVITPERQGWIREVHPELSFAAMTRGQAVAAGKRTAEGQATRRQLLADHGFETVVAQVEAHTGRGLKADDLLDACAVCWSARRLARKTAQRLPDEPERDARGLEMAIWY
ncbi:MAG: DUF429 domain-containing protein [Bacteroidota bacterium]